MIILVPIKRVPDYQAKVRVKADGSGIETDGIKWIVNPFDEIAVEEALKLKESGKAQEVVVATIGPVDARNQLLSCLAMGADRAIHVKSEQALDSSVAADVMLALYQKGSYGLILMGKQAIDSDASQTPQLLAAKLSLPQATFASKVTIEGDSCSVTREVDGGLETIKVKLPCVISTDLRLNTPRYAKLPDIMKAKKKPIEELELSALLPNSKVRIKILKMSMPEKRSAGKKVDSVEALVSALRDQAKVI